MPWAYFYVHESKGENPPIASYYLITFAGPLSLPIHGPRPNGILITVESEKNLVKKGVTSFMLLGPPRFNIKTAVS